MDKSENKKNCFFCSLNIKYIDYKNTELLRNYINYQGKIFSPKKTKTCAKHQRKLSTAIKRARIMALLPFVRK